VSPRCTCGSVAPFDECCGPILAGAAAGTAEALMRSRFSAFARADREHLLRSWHPSTRPRRLDLDDGTVWRRLQIVATEAGGPADERGVVEFRASYRTPDGAGLLHERSRFVRSARRWVYLDGTLLD
jgi:SEC-C motif domain protein